MHSLTLKSLDLFHIACSFLEPRRSKHNPNYKKYLFHFYFGIFEQFLIFEKQNFQNYKLDLKSESTSATGLCPVPRELKFFIER